MKRIFQALVSCLAGGALISGALAAPAPDADAKPAKPLNATELFGDSVVVKGKGFEIKRSQLDDEVFRLKGQVAARGRNLSPDESAALEKQVLDQLIQLAILRLRTTDADKKAATELA